MAETIKPIKDCGYWEAYSYYLKQVKPMRGLDGKKTRGAYGVNAKTFIEINKEFYKEVMRLIIEESFIYKIPFRLGTLGIRKFKQNFHFKDNELVVKKLLVDYKATKEWWKENPKAKEEHKYIYQMNDHTNGYKIRFMWSKKSSKAHGIRGYRFIATRANKRYLAKCFKNNPNIDYYA